MSHELTIDASGRASFAFLNTDGPAWHGLGNPLPADATDEQWLTEAGFDFRIQRAKVRFATEHGADATTWAEYPGSQVLLRSDTKAPLAIVSDKFKIVQPAALFKTLRDESVKAGFNLKTMGTLYGGRRFWLQVSDDTEAEIVPGDRVRALTLLTTATDGTLATTGKKTNVRVVCKNTQEQALGGHGAASRQSHRTTYDAQAMREAMGLTHDVQGFAAYVGAMKRAADKQVSKDRAEVLLFNLLADKSAKAEPSLAQAEKVSESAVFKKIMSLFQGAGMGAGMDGVKGTGWGFINAVTEYADHHARATSDDNRTTAALFGAGARLKAAAEQAVAAL